jgi:hypothetical protein
VEVCVEVVEALWNNIFPKIGLQDAGPARPRRARFIFSDLPKIIMDRRAAAEKLPPDGTKFRPAAVRICIQKLYQ